MITHNTSHGFAEIVLDGPEEKLEKLAWMKEVPVEIPEDVKYWLDKLNMFHALQWCVWDLKSTPKYKSMEIRCIEIGLDAYYDEEAKEFRVKALETMYQNITIEKSELSDTYLVKGDSKRFGEGAILHENYSLNGCIAFAKKQGFTEGGRE